MPSWRSSLSRLVLGCVQGDCVGWQSLLLVASWQMAHASHVNRNIFCQQSRANSGSNNCNWQRQLATATDNCGNCGRSMMLLLPLLPLLLLLLTLSRTEFFTRHFPWAAAAAFSDYYTHTRTHTCGTTNWLLLLAGLKVN